MSNVSHEVICYFSLLISASQRERCKHEDETIFGSSSRLIMGCISVLSRLSVSLEKDSQLNLAQDAQLGHTFHTNVFGFITLGFFTFPFWKEHQELFSLRVLACQTFYLAPWERTVLCLIGILQMFSLFITANFHFSFYSFLLIILSLFSFSFLLLHVL